MISSRFALRGRCTHRQGTTMVYLPLTNEDAKRLGLLLQLLRDDYTVLNVNAVAFRRPHAHLAAISADAEQYRRRLMNCTDDAAFTALQPD